MIIKSKRLFLVSLLLPLVALHGADAPKSRPNIVLMLADDLGYNNLGCYGTDRILTPNIDRLAVEGARFTDAHAPAAVCQPTRYGILAGRDYYRCSWHKYQSGTYFRDNEQLLPKLLQEAGYSTAMFGKWHLGFGFTKKGEETDWNAELTQGPNAAGFEYWFGMPNSHNTPPFVFIENNRIYKGDPRDPVKVVSAEEAKALGGTGDEAHGGSVGAKAAHAACDRQHLDLIMAERASAWISKQSKDKPFFLYLPFFAPHVPLLPSKEFQKTSPLGKAFPNNNAGRLGDFIQQLDAAVGTVLKTLQERGFAENTLVIFSSDNGNVNFGDCCAVGYRSNGMFLGQKTDAWEGGHRVPFLARWPGRIPAGATSGSLLSLLDLFKTCLVAAGVPCPEGAATDSLNQLPVLLAPAAAAPVRRGMVYGTGRALRVDRWVYVSKQGSMGSFGTGYMKPLGYANSDFTADGVLKPDAPPAQLYRLSDDPQQSVNLYTRYPAVARAMDAALKAIINDRRSNKPIDSFLPPASVLDPKR